MQNDKVIVKEPWIIKILGWIVTVVFGAGAAFSIWALATDENSDPIIMIICGTIFGLFTLMGIGLILDGARRRLEFDGSDFTYVPFLGKKKTLSYAQVSGVDTKTLNFGTPCLTIFDENTKKWASVEMNMTGYLDMLKALKDSGLLEKTNAKFEEKKKQQEKRLQKRVDKIIRPSEGLIKFSFVFGLVIIAFVVFYLITFFAGLYKASWVPVTTTAFIFVYILYFAICGDAVNYMNLLSFNQRIGTKLLDEKEATENRKKYGIKIPVVLFAYCSLILAFFPGLIYTEIYTFPDFKQALYSGLAIIAVIVIPIVLIRNKKIRLPEILWIFIFACFAGFVGSYQCNLALQKEKAEHVEVQVLSTKTTGGSSKDYYVYVFDGHEILIDMNTTKEVYEAANDGKQLVICKHKSVFGAEIWNLHVKKD